MVAAGCNKHHSLVIYVYSQAVGHLIAAVLKENVLSNKINQSSNQVCDFAFIFLSPIALTTAFVVQHD